MSTGQDITLYSTSWCGFCKMAKDYFHKHDIAFKEVDVEKDQAAAMYVVQKTQQMGVPVIQIDDQFIVGFDRPKIEAALKQQ